MATIEELEVQLAASQARVKEVSDEAKGHRLNAAEARAATEVAHAARVASETASTTQHQQIETLNDQLTKAQQSAVRANLRAAAKEAGAADPSDMLALIPADQFKVSKDGEIENAAELMTALKAAKPYLFGQASTSSVASVPKTEPPVAKRAVDMTDEEYQAARAAAVKR